MEEVTVKKVKQIVKIIRKMKKIGITIITIHPDGSASYDSKIHELDSVWPKEELPDQPTAPLEPEGGG